MYNGCIQCYAQCFVNVVCVDLGCVVGFDNGRVFQIAALDVVFESRMGDIVYNGSSAIANSNDGSNSKEREKEENCAQIFFFRLLLRDKAKDMI